MSKSIHAGFKIGKDDATSIAVIDALIRRTLPFDLPYACKNYIYRSFCYAKDGKTSDDVEEWFSSAQGCTARIISLHYKRIEQKPYKYMKQMVYPPSDWIIVVRIEFLSGNTRYSDYFRVFDSISKNLEAKTIIQMIPELEVILTDGIVKLVPYKYVQSFVDGRRGNGDFVEK